MSEEQTQTSEAQTTSEATTVTTEGTEQSTTSYLDGKYESVSALEAGYTELQSSYSKKNAEYNENIANFAATQAPDEYTLSEGVETSNRIEALQAFGKENNMSNEMLNKIIAMDSESNTAAQIAHVAEQKELLGKDAETRLTNLQDWARANGGDEAVFNGMVTSAKAVEFLESVMKGSSGTMAAPVAAAPAINADQLKDMRFEMDRYGNRRMASEPAFRAKVEALEAQSARQR